MSLLGWGRRPVPVTAALVPALRARCWQGYRGGGGSHCTPSIAKGCCDSGKNITKCYTESWISVRSYNSRRQTLVISAQMIRYG